MDPGIQNNDDSQSLASPSKKQQLKDTADNSKYYTATDLEGNELQLKSILQKKGGNNAIPSYISEKHKDRYQSPSKNNKQQNAEDASPDKGSYSSIQC